MGLFAYDPQFKMFDVTPVPNQFILEYMPTARPEYVKVYLYGLMQCCHPDEDMSITQMSHDLNLPEDDILAAYRHWERRGLVRRVSDQPPQFRYISVLQQFFAHSDAPRDSAYEDFAESLYGLFGEDRKLHGKETSMAYEWVEELGLPPEVVLMLISHMMTSRGKQFSFASAQKLAVQLAEEKVATIDDAEIVLTRSSKIEQGTRRVIRMLGKRSRNPSDAEMAMYGKWMKEWGYTPEAIEAACAETTKGEPTMAYLDGILNGMMKRRGKAATTEKQVERQRQEEQAQMAPLKALIKAMNLRATVNVGTLALYDSFRELYGDDVILLAGKQCATKSDVKLDDVLALLQAWKKRGLTDAAQVQAYIDEFNGQNRFLAALFDLWGRKERPNAGDRTLLTRWQQEYGYGEEMILTMAPFARNAGSPMPYLDKLLQSIYQQGITTPEAALAANAAYQEKQAADRAAKPSTPLRGPKVVREQQYEQREYEDNNELPDWMKAKIKELNGDA